MKQIGTIVVLGSVLFALQLFAFSEPSSPPPGANTPAPLNIGSVGQSKAGGLILNTGGASYGLIVDQGSVGIGTQSPTQKLDVLGYVRGTTGLCIGGDCRTGWPGVGGLDVSGPINQTSCDSGQEKITKNLCMDQNFSGPVLAKDGLFSCVQNGGHVCRLDEYYAACKIKGTGFTPPPFLVGDVPYVHVDYWIDILHTTSYGASDPCTFHGETAQSYLDPDSGHRGTFKYKCCYGVSR